MIPAITASQMARIDELAPQHGISLESMMEKAGMNTAELARRLLGKNYKSKAVCHLVGKGNNGGDSVAAARYLAGWGIKNILIFSHPFAELKDSVKRQISLLPERNMEIIPDEAGSEILAIMKSSGLIIDGLIGYSLKGSPYGKAARLIDMANMSGQPILAIDVPSGLDSTTGIPSKSAIIAVATISFGLPKTGLLKETSKKYAGSLYVADIGIPSSLCREIGVEVGDIFSKEKIVKIH